MNTKAEWLTDKYITVMLLVFPLWTGVEGYSAVTLAKFAFFAVATAVWALGLVICLITERAALKRPSAPQWAALALMGAACLSAAASPYGGVLLGSSRWDGLFTFLLYGCIFLGVSAFGRPRKRYIRLLAASCALCCGVAVMQLGRINALWLFPEGLDFYGSGVQYTGAFLGTIGNTDVLSAYLCLCVPAFVGFAVLGDRPKAERPVGVPYGRNGGAWAVPCGVAALGAIIAVCSGVSGGVLALIGAALICVPYLIYKRTGNRRAVVIACFCSALCILAGLIVCWFWPGEGGTMWEASQILHGNVDDSFGAHRIEIWRECLRLVRERPIFGGGPDTLGLRTELGYSRFVPESGLTLAVHIDNAHNEFLGYLVNLGILGLISYLSLVGLTLRRALKAKSAVSAALGCGVVCYLMQSFFGLGLCLIVPLVFIAMGLICSRKEE